MSSAEETLIMTHDELKFFREKLQALEAENRALKSAIEDYETADQSDDFIRAKSQAIVKIRDCYRRYCINEKTRRETGWLLPEESRNF